MCCDTMVGKNINVVQVGTKRLFGILLLYSLVKNWIVD